MSNALGHKTRRLSADSKAPGRNVQVMERMGFSMGVIQREWVGMRELGAMIRAGMAGLREAEEDGSRE